ncbi:potential GTPase Activating protein [Rhizophagus clarus]|uniref:Potential GTPase Activating protein n=1 Tax=Rhizophagus clarus TaxID=94130 RepID=A0A8H3MFH5_9GLOM|nr:potential GTPase Activating protein [Rhizophagus clarus]
MAHAHETKVTPKRAFSLREVFGRPRTDVSLADTLGLTSLNVEPNERDGKSYQKQSISPSNSPKGKPIDTKLLVQELQKPYPLHTLIKLIRELCNIVTQYTFSDMTEVWVCVRDLDLLSPDMPFDARNVAFQFMIACIKGQHSDNLGFLRVIFYDCIKSHNVKEDFEIRLLALKELCKDGRDISPFEKNLVKILSEWVNETVQQLDVQITSDYQKEHAKSLPPSSSSSTTSSQQDDSNISFPLSTSSNRSSSSATITEASDSDIILQQQKKSEPTRLQSVVNLLINVVKFNFAQFEEPDISRLIEDISIACKKSKDVSDIECCLRFWDVVVRFGYVPSSSLKSYVDVLCDKLNQGGSISQTSWHIMRNLLKSHCAYSAIKILFSNLESVEPLTSLRVLRGSVLFLAWAIWGPEEVDSLSHTYSTVLSAMRHAIKNYCDVNIHCEILMQINNLISKYEKDIKPLEWEIIMDILDNTKHYVLNNGSLEGRNTIMNDETIKIDSVDDNEITTVVSAHSKIIFQIHSLHMSSSFEGPILRFINLVQSLRDYVSENIILMLLDYYDLEHSLYPSSPDWLVLLVDMVNTFYIAKVPSRIRQRVLSMTVEVYEITKDFYQDKLLEAVILPMFINFPCDDDPEVIDNSMEFLISVLKELPNRWFTPLLKILLQCTPCVCQFNQPDTKQLSSHLLKCKSLISISGLINIFQHCLYKADSPAQSIKIFKEMLKLLRDSSTPVTCRLALLQLLVRMRADNDHRIYFTEDIDVVSGAYVLHRDKSVNENNFSSNSTTSEKSAINIGSTGSGVERKTSLKKKVERRASLKDVASILLDRRDNNKSTQHQIDNNNIPEEETSCERLWQIPEILRIKILALRPSPYVLCNKANAIQDILQEDNDSFESDSTVASSKDTKLQETVVLPINLYLECLIDILTKDKNWEIYSYVLCFFPIQLSKKHLFCSSFEQIRTLRSCLCDWVLNNRLTEGVSLPSDVKRADVYVIVYQTLTILINYNDLFNKAQRDELILAFHVGLQKWAHTAKPCIHALNICLFELPLSSTKLLPDTLNKLSQIITTASMSVHILEFLSGLARLPDLYVNFTEADYKRVFGIAMQYIQYSQSQTVSSTSAPNSNNSTSSQPNTSSNSVVNTSQSTNALSQYERVMAYHVIYLWFMLLRLPERRKYVTFIVHGLLFANGSNSKVDEQTETCFDMLARYSFANCDPKPEKSFINQILLEQGKDKVISRTWVQGNALLTMRTMKSFGWAEIIIRRPSGTAAFLCKVENRNKMEDSDFITLPATLMSHYNPDFQNIVNLPQSAIDFKSKQSDVTVNDFTQEKTNDHSIIENTNYLVEPQETEENENSIVVESNNLPVDISSQLTSSNFEINSYAGTLEKDIRISTSQTEVLPNLESIHGENQGDNLKDRVNMSSFSVKEQYVVNEVFTDPASLIADKNIYRKDDPHIDPSFLFLQFSPYPDFISKDAPQPLPDDESTNRALTVLDHTPVVDFHKIGVLYVGKNQTKETEILSNIHGSQDYVKFLNKLGSLIRLKNCKNIYTGGLDTEYDTDGEYTYYWNDDITQVIFHCATLMPTNLAHDPQCAGKKRHIGNDFVTIVFNDSGQEYEFNTLPSHFNFINIVISPYSHQYSSQTSISTLQSSRADDTNKNYDKNSFFKVIMQRRSDMPEIGPIESRMVSASALPAFVRQIALHANIFAQVFLQSGGNRNTEYVSNWKDRLRQIKRIKERILSSSTGSFNVLISTLPISEDPATVKKNLYFVTEYIHARRFTFKRKSRSRSPRKSRSSRRHKRRSYSKTSSSKSRSRSRERRRRSPIRSRDRSRDRSRGRRRVSRRDEPDPSHVLGVFNLSLRTTEKDLQNIFERYGRVNNVTIVYDHRSDRSRGFGFVYMNSVEEATMAKDKTNGMELNGRNMRVDYSLTQRPHTPTPGEYMGDRPRYQVAVGQKIEKDLEAAVFQEKGGRIVVPRDLEVILVELVYFSML